MNYLEVVEFTLVYAALFALYLYGVFKVAEALLR